MSALAVRKPPPPLPPSLSILVLLCNECCPHLLVVDSYRGVFRQCCCGRQHTQQSLAGGAQEDDERLPLPLLCQARLLHSGVGCGDVDMRGRERCFKPPCGRPRTTQGVVDVVLAVRLDGVARRRSVPRGRIKLIHGVSDAASDKSGTSLAGEAGLHKMGMPFGDGCRQMASERSRARCQCFSHPLTCYDVSSP